jgi:hypothetical protein
MPHFQNVAGQTLSFTALYDNERDVRTFAARRLEGDVQFSHRYSKATRILWRYTWRNVQVDSSTLKINPELIPLLSQPSRIGMIATSIIRTGGMIPSMRIGAFTIRSTWD